MDPNEEMCNCLVKWLQSLSPERTKTLPEISDGVGMLELLLQLDYQHFSKWEQKIKKDVGTNWRLKISNLKKIAEAVIEYYQEILQMQVLELGRPDVNKIGEKNDPIQLAKLLRLILGCAINCDRKQEYITQIMEMDQTVQQNIMQAIQQLDQVAGGSGRSLSLILDGDNRVAKLLSELDSANEAKESLLQQIHSLEQQVQILQEEKQVLLNQQQVLIERESRSPDTRKQIENLKEELFKSEVIRDDLKAKVLEQDKQILAFQEKIAELQIAANNSSRLKDEVDALSESAAKAADLEQVLASYKKKLENYQDLKKNLQKFEDKNVEYLQKNMELEEELSKHAGLKSQCDAFKAQITELQQKLDEETQRADKVQFNLETCNSKLIALQNQRDRLIQERDSLKEENEELRLGKAKPETGAAVLQELTPTEMKERLRFLERENGTLKTARQELESKLAQLDGASNRIDRLVQQNRSLNQTVIKLEAQIEELKSTGVPNNSKELQQKVSYLQEALTVKDNELQVAQSKLRKNLEKAREVVQNLEVKSNGSIDSFKTQMPDYEGRLMTVAFHKLGLNCQREAIGEKLGGQNNSFLARQRQATPRKHSFNPK